MSRDHNHTPGSGCCQQDVFEGESLFKAIDVPHVRAMNESVSGSCRTVLREYSRRAEKDTWMESGDDDPEMIIHVPFTSTVRVKAVCLSTEPGHATPGVLRLFANRPQLDFEGAADATPEQALGLSPDGDPEASLWHPLKAAKFSNISSVQVHLRGNCGRSTDEEGEPVRVFYIGFRGEVTGWRHGPVTAVYEARAQLADHKAPDSDKAAGFLK